MHRRQSQLNKNACSDDYILKEDVLKPFLKQNYLSSFKTERNKTPNNMKLYLYKIVWIVKLQHYFVHGCRVENRGADLS